MPTRNFTKKQLTEELGLPYEPADEVDIIEDEIYDTSRWSVHHELIFKFENKFWSTSYSVGATEMQDERPWEYEDVIECVEVEPVTVTKIEYRPVGSKESETC